MTPEQLEAAARKLCEIRGKNPDEETQFGNFNWETKTITLITWLKEMEQEIRAYLEIQEAIQSATRNTTPTRRYCPNCHHADNWHFNDGCGMKGCECTWTYHQAAGTETPKPEPVSICLCGHLKRHHKSDDSPTRCCITDCLCDWFTEDTGATIEANKTL